MKTLILIVIIIFLIYLLKVNQKKGNKKNNNKKLQTKIKDNKFYYKKKKIVTNTEYEFYKILKEITDKHECILCLKVGLKDFAETIYKNNRSDFLRISQKHVDFLICDKELNTLFAIELDDKSHYNKQAQKNDIFKNEFYKTIGIPLYRIKTGYYNKESIEETIFKTENKIQ